MKKFSFAILLAILVQTAYAQSETAQLAYENEVNETIWKPFKQTYEARDWQGFNKLHTDDVLRVHDGGIRQGADYKNSIRESYEKYSDRKVTIDFAMERRMRNEDVAYETGFYRVLYREPDKEPKASFGRFHVVLKRIEGHWKIAQDWDSNSFNGRPITAGDFEKVAFLDLSE